MSKTALIKQNSSDMTTCGCDLGVKTKERTPIKSKFFGTFGTKCTQIFVEVSLTSFFSFYLFYFGGDETNKNMNKIRQFYIFMISPISLLDGTGKMVRKEAKKTVMSTWLTKKLTIGRFSGKNRTWQSSGEERGESI